MQLKEEFVRRYAGLGCLLIALVGTSLIRFGIAQSTPLTKVAAAAASCVPATAPSALEAVVDGQYWTGIFVLLAVSAAYGLWVASSTLVEGVFSDRPNRVALGLILLAGGSAIVVNLVDIWMGRPPHMLISQLVNLLADPSCRGVARSVLWSRTTGEPVALLLGVAMSSLAGFGQPPNPAVLARRYAQLSAILNATSFLFVVGLLTAHANLRLALGHVVFAGIDDAARVRQSLTSVGILQSGVAYTALLAVFFGPSRILLAWRIRQLTPPKASFKRKRAWLENEGLGGRWQDDVRHVLALVAPALSGPVIDSLTK